MSDKLTKETRREMKKPDAFVAWGRKWFTRVAGNTRRVVTSVTVLVVLAFGWYGFTRWKAHQSEKAWEAFYDAYKLEEPARWDAVSKMHASHVGTRAGSFAAILLGDHYLQSAKSKVEKDIEAALAQSGGAKKKEALFSMSLTSIPAEKENSQKAVEWYGKARQFSGLLDEERQLIEINIANALEISGDLKQAESAYQSASAVSPVSKGLALLGVGRVVEMQGDKDRAVKVYEEIAKEFSGSEKNREYERLAQSALRRVQSRLLNASN